MATTKKKKTESKAVRVAEAKAKLNASMAAAMEKNEAKKAAAKETKSDKPELKVVGGLAPVAKFDLLAERQNGQTRYALERHGNVVFLKRYAPKGTNTDTAASCLAKRHIQDYVLGTDVLGWLQSNQHLFNGDAPPPPPVKKSTELAKPVKVDSKDVEVIVPMTKPEARACVDAIKKGIDAVREKAFELYSREGWKALGYDSFRKCIAAEFTESEPTIYRELQAAKVEVAIDVPIGSLPAYAGAALVDVPPPVAKKIVEEAKAPSGKVAGKKVVSAAEQAKAEHDAKIRECLRAALRSIEGWEARLKRAYAGLNDRQMREFIAKEFTGGGGATTPAPGWWCEGGADPKLIVGPRDNPLETFSGKKLLDRARDLLGIPYPMAGGSKVNGKPSKDPKDVEALRKAGKIPAGAVVEVDEPEELVMIPQDAAADEALSDADWLKALPCSSKLRDTVLARFSEQALLYRQSRSILKGKVWSDLSKLAKAKGPFSYAVGRFLRTPHPKHWVVCPTAKDGGCGGTGEVPAVGRCPKCKGDGFILNR